MTPQGVWESILAEIGTHLKPDTFERWFSLATLKDLSTERLTIEVPNIFYKNWILEHCSSIIESKLKDLAGPEAQFIISVAGENGEDPSLSACLPGPRPKRLPTRRRRTSSNNGNNLNPRYTFANFVEGPCNRFARAAALAAAEAPGQTYNPVFIYGGVGLGKTHLMQAIGHHMLAQLKAVTIHYVSSETFTNHLIHSLQTRQMESFRRSYRYVNALLIDDIEFLSGKEQTQEEFFHTFNALSDLHSQIVVSSDRPPAELADMEKRLVSRFQSGLVVDLQVPDLETRVVILLRHAAYRGINLPENVAFFIAEKIRSNIRVLEGALVQVACYGSVMKHPLTVGLAQQVLHDMLMRFETSNVTLEAIQKRVADEFDIRLADMKSPRRPKTIAWPRQVAMYLCRELTPHSLQHIGESFGGRNHATVIHAHRLIERKTQTDSKLRFIVTKLRRELSQA